MGNKTKHAQNWAREQRQIMAFINQNRGTERYKVLPPQTNGHRHGTTELADRDMVRALMQESASR